MKLEVGNACLKHQALALRESLVRNCFSLHSAARARVIVAGRAEGKIAFYGTKRGASYPFLTAGGDNS